jgi:hypothetical protein
MIFRKTDVNFTNIFLAAFSYERVLRSFYVLRDWVCNIFLRKDRKVCSKNVGLPRYSRGFVPEKLPYAILFNTFL